MKPGYKQTEVGVIPKEWDVVTLAAVAKQPMQNGLFFKPSQKGAGVKLINVGDLFSSSPIDVNKLELFNATSNECERFKVEDGDLFFTRSSIVPSGIAHCNLYRAEKSETVVFDSHVIRFRPKQNIVAPEYLFKACLASVARQYLVSHAKSGTMTTIDQGVLGSCPVLLPSRLEQSAIVEVLNDADALVESLEQLLAKKRNLKQGAMQELLTGKRRLPGFSDAWKPHRLDSLGQWTGGMTPSMSNLAYWEQGTIPWISSGDVKVTRLASTAFSITAYAVKQKATTLIPAQSIVVVTRSGILRKHLPVAMTTRPMAINQDIKAISPLGPVSSEYLLHTLTYHGDEILGRCLKSGTTVESIEFSWFKSFTIPLPPKQEQTVIAEVLTDMDVGISELESKLTKARQLKQGMMQELLTGRIRLI
jgi:type I restriction enzyme S subunit